MGARFRSWWQKARKPFAVFGIIVIGILILALLAVIVMVYIFNVNVPGLRGKTLWDWLQLLIIPAVLAVGGYLFNFTITRTEQESVRQRDRTERELTLDNQREAALQSYIDKISELLLEKKLRESQPEDEARTLARVRTLTTLPQLDNTRKGSVLQFLYESRLIEKDKSIITLTGANLSGAKLSGAKLNGTDLNGVNLDGADLTFANLNNTNLSSANLSNTLQLHLLPQH